MTGVAPSAISTVIGIGDPGLLRGYAMTGLAISPASTPEQMRAAWDALPAGVELVVLTPTAAAALNERTADPGAPLVAVLPEPVAPATEGGRR